jgi:hypothetical protein
MVGAGIDFALAARAHHVARTVLLIAEKRADPMNTLFLVGFSRIER